MANHSLQVRPLELAYTSCRVPGMVPPSTNHGNAGAGTKGGSICAKNCNGCLICSGAQRTGWLLHPPLFSPHEAGALPMGSRTLSAPSSTSNYPARGRAGSPRAGEMSWAGSTVHAVNSNRSRILGKIRLARFVISLNLEIGFLRVKSGFLKGQVSPSI